MGVRVIGDDKRIIVGVQPIAGRIEGEGGGESTLSFRPVTEQRIVDGTDNDGEPDVDGQAGFTDPESIAGADSGSSGDAPYGYTRTGRKRNRPVGSGSRGTSTRSTSKTTDSIASMLFVVHSVAGSMFKLPFLKIPKDGCKEIADAIVEVTELYDVPLNEKTMAWANLAGVMAKVYVFDGKAENMPSIATIFEKVEKKQPSQMPSFMTGTGRAN